MSSITRYHLRAIITKSTKNKLWFRQFGNCHGGLDPYGNPVTRETASVDHILPIKFFNINLCKEPDPNLMYYRYRKAANNIDNLQFMDIRQNKIIGSTLFKKTRSESVPELVSIFNARYGINLRLP